jgi:transcriptional regulator with XRE-family HTH domain
LKIGKTVRGIRKGKNLTIKDLAAISGIAPSLISQIENDKANPSLSTLISLAQAMEVHIMSFFGKEESSTNPVVRADKRTMIMERSGARFFSLTNDIVGDIEFLYCVYEKGGKSNQEVYEHKGAEALFVVSGTLEVELSGTRYVLESGDSIAFNSKGPHLARNIYDGVTVVVSVNSPPTF